MDRSWIPGPSPSRSTATTLTMLPEGPERMEALLHADPLARNARFASSITSMSMTTPASACAMR